MLDLIFAKDTSIRLSVPVLSALPFWGVEEEEEMRQGEMVGKNFWMKEKCS
jgi:hypothetical protein